MEIRLVSSRYLDSNPDDIRGVIRLYRDSWVVKETFGRTQVISPGKFFGAIDWIRSSCTYDGIADGVPILKTYQRYSGGYNKETQEENIEQHILCEITHIVPGPPDLSEFDVAQFLPPGVKIGEATEPVTFARLSAARIAAIVVGIVMIIIGIYLKIRSRN